MFVSVSLQQQLSRTAGRTFPRKVRGLCRDDDDDVMRELRTYYTLCLRPSLFNVRLYALAPLLAHLGADVCANVVVTSTCVPIYICNHAAAAASSELQPAARSLSPSSVIYGKT